MLGSGSMEVATRQRGSIGSGSAFSPVDASSSAQTVAAPPSATTNSGGGVGTTGAVLPHPSATRRRVLPGRPAKANKGTAPLVHVMSGGVLRA
jgi:hypothetical protein